MKLTIDFETRSPADLKKEGMYKYAEHPATDVMCLCFHVEGRHMNDRYVDFWVPPYAAEIIGNRGQERTGDLERLILQAHTIEAHNVEFERAIWNSVMVKKYGFHPLPEHKLRCSAAKASVAGLPRALGKACKAMRLSEQKDDEGNKVMMKLTKPRRPVKKEREQLEAQGWVETGEDNHKWLDPDGNPHWFFHENHEEYLRLIKYCEQDVRSEHALSSAIPDLSPQALELWKVDQKINCHGITVDIDSCHAMISLCDRYKDHINVKIQELTNGAVDSGSKVAAITEWLTSQGVELSSLDAAAIDTNLKRDDLEPHCREMLELRQAYSKSSVAKYQSAIRHAQEDHKIRGMFLFHGAHTGRWSGRGMQLQNLPSRGIIKDPEVALDAINNGMGIEMIEHLWGSVLKVASSCIRSVLKAREGHELIVADYSAIEGRILAWLAGEEYVLEDYRNDKDPYVTAAANVYGVPESKVTPVQRQVGKCIVLFCGYQGFTGAFQAAAKSYGIERDEELVKEDILAWRKSRPMTVRLWEQLNAAATMAILNPGKVAKYRMIQYKFDGTHLKCRLPSGRVLWYPFAQLKPDVTPWGQAIDAITYMSEDSMTRQWLRQQTYGGKLSENVTQSVSADIISHALVQLDKRGWNPILHVHDEIGCEEPIKDNKTVEQLCEIMCDLPPWAEGLPVTAEGWKGKRYRK